MYIYICVHTHTYNIYTVAIVYIYTYSISYIYTYSSIFTNYDDFVPAKCSFVVYISYIL